MNIYVLSATSLSKLAVLNTYKARSWNRVWGESGYFTIWAPITSETDEFFVKENLIWPDDQSCIGVIEQIHKYTDEDSGLPLIEISGRFIAASYLSRRIIWDNVLVVDYPAKVIQKIVQDNSIASSDSNRRFTAVVSTSLSLDSSVQLQNRITYCNSYGNLWEEVKKLSIAQGFNVEFNYTDTNSPELSGIVSMGQDKTDSVNLSTDLGFLTQSDYLWNSTDYCNVALVAGEGEGADREIVPIIPAGAVNLNRRELYVDARDLQRTSESTEEPMSDEEYEAALYQRGEQKLLDYPLYESYECSLQITGEEGYVFGQDYNLGDIVTLTDHKLRVQVQARVKEHQLSEDKDGRTDFLVFGLSTPTITALVKRRD